MSHWDSSETWYTQCVGEKGHYYHQHIVLPNVKRLLGTFSSLLDCGCGQGILFRSIPSNTEYVGVDVSKPLIASAKKLSPSAHFHVADMSLPLPLQKKDFERAVFLLSLQNMQQGEKAVQTASHHLKTGGKILLVLNHPYFRIPRQTSWGIDENMKLQYRRVNGYMTPQEIPIQTHPSKKKGSETTISYHHPLASMMRWLQDQSLLVEALEEWCSDKSSTGPKARMENRARREIPLFMAILAKKQ